MYGIYFFYTELKINTSSSFINIRNILMNFASDKFKEIKVLVCHNENQRYMNTKLNFCVTQFLHLFSREDIMRRVAQTETKREMK
jgi:hypothetical protein